MSNLFVSVIFLVHSSNKLILSLTTERSTISPSEAAAEYHRRIKLIEAGYNISNSLSDVQFESISTLDENFVGKHTKIVPEELYTTTLDPRFVRKIKQPLGYYKQLLMNKTTSKISKSPIVGLKAKSSKIALSITADKTSTKVKPSTADKIVVKDLVSTTRRWTPYPDYNSAEERSIQRKCPMRINLIRRMRDHYEYVAQNLTVTYSSESVPSSCECHAGNWSESYDAWEKWKQKQCKPGFLNLEYGLNQEGTKFRKGHEPQWYKDEQANARAESGGISSQEYRGKIQSHKKYNKHRAESQQPIGYPPQQMLYPSQAIGYPQQMSYVQQPMGYPHPVYYPHPMQPQYYPQHNPYNEPVAMNPLTYEKLAELHKDIKELKERTTISLWEQYLKLKEKFEPMQKISSTSSSREKLDIYRKVERREPFYSKMQSNVNQIRANNPYNQSQWVNNRARLQMNDHYQRSIQNQDIYRQNHFLHEDQRENEREAVSPQFRRVTRDHIYKNEPFNRYRTMSPRQYYRVSDPSYNDRNLFVSRGTRFQMQGTYQREWQSNSWSYRTRESYSQRPISQPPIKDVKLTVLDTRRSQMTRTLPPPPPSSTILNVGKEKTTEDPLKIYQKYKAQYEFPDYVGEKRRLLRAKEKEAKRLLYKARGLEYDEAPPRTTTRPSTTTYSRWTFENMMEYYKWMFGDESLPIETPTRTPFNNAPTFDMGHEDGQKAYLKWLLDDKTLEIDPISD